MTPFLFHLYLKALGTGPSIGDKSPWDLPEMDS